MKQIVVTLDGLSCVNCGGKIEKVMNQRQDVKLARLDFALNRMILEVDDQFDHSKYDEIKNQILEIEDVRVFFDEEKQEIAQPIESRKWYGSIAIGLIALLVSLLSTHLVANVFVLVSYGIIGYPVLKKAGRRLLAKQWFDENFLMSIATLGAIAIGELPEAVGVMLFYTVGEYFQDKAVHRSKVAISSLLDLKIEEAMVVTESGLSKMKPEEVSIADVLFVPVGGKVACDGMISEGTSSLDVKALSGESLPQDVSEGDEVLAGSVNLQSPIFVRVTHPYRDSSMAKMVRYMEEASAKKANVETMMNRFAAIYTPIVVGLSVIVMIVLMMTGLSVSDSIYRGLIFLVISCPCALVISIPLSYFASMGYASKQGILFKGGLALEAAKDIDVVIFDKTGTLTEGKLKVEKVVSLNDWSTSDILLYARSLERYSTHPIAKAILNDASAESFLDVSHLDEVAGFGVFGEIANQQVSLKKISELDEQEIGPRLRVELSQSESSVIGLFVNQVCVGFILISDQLKETSQLSIAELSQRKIQTGMLSGDRDSIVQDIARRLGLNFAYSQLLPEEKVKKTEEFMGANHRVAFVGDGINDAAVLSMSHLGIAMGNLGSDAAIYAADVVLLKDDPKDVLTVLDIAKKTHHVVVQNLVFVFVVKGLMLTLGAFGLAGMWEAVFADVGVALLAIMNAMRVLYAKQ